MAGQLLTRIPGRAVACTGEDLVGVQPVEELYGTTDPANLRSVALVRSKLELMAS